MEKGVSSYLVWIIVIVLEWLILKIAGRPQLWLYVSIPIIIALIYTEYTNRPVKNKRNLR